MMSVKQGSIKYHFFSLWYDSTWDWTQVSRAIGKHSNHYERSNAPSLHPGVVAIENFSKKLLAFVWKTLKGLK